MTTSLLHACVCAVLPCLLCQDPGVPHVDNALSLSLSSPIASLCPFEALPLKLSVTNRSNATVAVDDLPLHGDSASDYAEIVTPAGERTKLHQVQQRLVQIENGPSTNIQLKPGATQEFTMLLGSGEMTNAIVFEVPGSYEIAVVMAGARSNPVHVECLPAPDSEAEALGLVRTLQADSQMDAFYDGRLIFVQGDQKRQQFEALAWLKASRVYASHAKLALAERAEWLAHGFAPNDPTRAAELFSEAEDMLAAISPGSALGHAGQSDSYVSFKLAALSTRKAKDLKHSR